MPALPVFLDTSTLPRDPRGMPLGFQRLCDLAQGSLVEVYLPEVVIHEWQGGFLDQLRKKILEAERGLSRALAHPWIEDLHCHNGLAAASADMEGALEAAPGVVESRVTALVHELRARVLPTGDGHARRVLAAYFAGAAPFSAPRSRADLPDAFVFECLRDLIPQLASPCQCIVGDGALASAILTLPHTAVYSSIDEFVTSEAVETLARQYDPDRLWASAFPAVVDYLGTVEHQISARVASLLPDALGYAQVQHQAIPDDTLEALVTGVYEPAEVALQWSGLRDFGAGLLELPFSAECDAEIEFWVYRSEAFDVPLGVWVHYGDPELEHYFESGGRVRLLVVGALGLTVHLSSPATGEGPDLADIVIDRIDTTDILEDGEGLIFLLGPPADS